MARAIDADALQELCNRRIQDTWNSGTAPVSWAHAYADFKDDIDSMPTLTPPNEPLTLISMSDEIPPDNERVLVYRPCMVDSDTGPYSVQWGWAAKRDGSHWARLPDRRPTAEEMEKLEGME